MNHHHHHLTNSTTTTTIHHVGPVLFVVSAKVQKCTAALLRCVSTELQYSSSLKKTARYIVSTGTDLINQQESELNISINNEVCVEVIIILAKWVDESLGHFEPANIEDKLERTEDWEVVIVIFVSGLDVLQTKQVSQEVRVDSESNNL